MSFGSYLANGFRILGFEKAAVPAITTDPDLKKHALLLTAILSAFIGVFVSLALVGLLYFLSDSPLAAAMSAAVGGLGLGAVFLLAAIVIALVAFFFILISAGIYHLSARLFGGQSAIMPFYATLLSMQFALGLCGVVITFLTLIPFLGFLINIGWTIYSICVLVFVIREVYQISTPRAVFATLLPFVLLFVLVFGALFLIFLASFGGATLA